MQEENEKPMAPSSGYSSSSGELWGLPMMPSKIEIDLLLPNGIYIEIEVARETMLMDLKDKVWGLAQEYPLYNTLLEQSCYIFVGITQDAECEEFYNEKQRLCDLHLFRPMLRLIEAEGNREEKIIKRDISVAIGRCVNEFDRMKSKEVDQFRYDVSQHCKNRIIELNKTLNENNNNHHSLLEQLLPPRLETTILPSSIVSQKSNKIHITVWSKVSEKFGSKNVSISMQVLQSTKPSDLLNETVAKFLKSNSKVFQSVDDAKLSKAMLCNLYTLKICGFNEYLIGNHPITCYKHVRQFFCRNEILNLTLTPIKDALVSIPKKHLYLQPKIAKCKAMSNNKSSQITPSSSIKQFFRLHVLSAAYVNLKDQDKVYVYLNIFHGDHELSTAQKTQSISGTPKWDEWLEFNISVCDIPRGAKLCIAICAMKKKKEKDEYWPLAWANLCLLDYAGFLLQGKLTVYLWPVPYQMEASLNPLGITGSNPCKDLQSLELEFTDFGYEVQYPPKLNIPVKELACPCSSTNTQSVFVEDFNTVQHIDEILSHDPLYEISCDDRDLLWNSRKHCINIPESLPKLLQSVNWHQKDEVSQIYTLLRQWQLLSPEIALELLDNKYTDPNVRNFATKCLEYGLSDDDLLKYLLQLVTALKHELYLNNSLTIYLLTKAIANPHIGHYFFWHLKAEMHNPEVSLRYALILEAFLRASGEHLNNFAKQTEMLEKLMNLNSNLRKRDVVTCKVLWDHLRKPDFKDTMENLCSPINPDQYLGHLQINLCEVKTSAKRPFILHWDNSDPFSEHVEPNLAILFKNGDDLRQDQLTLQILHVMDDIWQQDNLDLYLTPYRCISMGNNVGMIEIVQHAETLFSVQKREGVVGSLQLKSGCLHQWLKRQNKGRELYDKAIQNFTLSCAGYCVATFVLGIGDRHNDNIMVKKNGQLFHIDFGHFLNHKKKKYGFKRERLPFVLTNDFMKVICRGVNDPSKAKEYVQFQDLCVKAYKSIRSHSNLILNLLSLMIGAGIPELASYADLAYTRDALGVNVSESEAAE